MSLNKMTVFWFNLCIILNWFSNVHSDFNDTPGTIWPPDPEIHVGDSVNISCRMNSASFRGSTVKDLYFQNAKTGEIVPASNIVIINDTTIVYMLRNAKEQYTTYRCKCGEFAIKDVNVYVGFKPQNVTDFTCRSYDYMRMQCNFTKPDNPVLTQYNLSFHFDTANYKYFPTCTLKPPLMVCESEKDMYRANEEIYHYKLIATNSLGELTQFFDISNTKIMVPARPGQDFQSIEITSVSATFFFRMPKYEAYYRSKGLQWEVLLKPQNFTSINISDAVRYNKRNEFSLYFQNLDYAYYGYQLQLRARLQEAQLWSDPFTYKFRTAARRPRPPRIDVGGFYTDPSEANIRLYWELLQPHEFNGDNFTYVIENRNGEILSTVNNSALFKWNKGLQYEFILRSQNHLGISDSFSSIIIPAMLPYGKSKTHTTPAVHNIYHGTNGTYTLTWEAPEDMDNLTDYTVFWCRSRRATLNGCEGSIHFQHVSRDVLKFTTAPHMYTLTLAVSANYKDFNTGMHWTKCTMNEESDLVKMEPEVEAISSTTIKIQWGSESICPSIFERYNLSYCEIIEPEMTGESENEVDNKSSINYTCSRNDIGDTRRFVLINKSFNRWELQNLKPYTFYKIEMFMYSLRKVGKTSDPQIVRTFEAAPSQPLQLKVVNIRNTSASISWLPPQEPNGLIRSYIIVLNNERREITAGSNDMNGRIPYELKGLNSSTLYKVYVLARTLSNSEPSNNISFTTLVGYPSIPRGVKVEDSNNEATIEWANQTERTDYYEVAITVMQNDEIIKRRISVVNGSNFCVFNIPQCFDPNYRTTVDVRAVNALSTHEVNDIDNDENSYPKNVEEQYYEGNDDLRCINKVGTSEKQAAYKQKRQQEDYERYKNVNINRLYKSDWQRGNVYSCSSGAIGMILIYIASAVLITLGTFLLIYLIRQKYNKMANIHCTLPAGLDAYISKDFSSVNSTFPRDFIAVIKDEISNTLTEENNATMQRNEQHNEEHRLLETTSNDSVSLNEHQQQQLQQSQIQIETLPELTSVDMKQFNEIGIASNPLCGSDCELTTSSQSECNNCEQTTRPTTLTPYVQASEITTAAMSLPPKTNCGYIKPSALTNWQNSLTQASAASTVPSGYITVESINGNVLSAASKHNSPNDLQGFNVPTNNGYIQSSAFEPSKFNFKNNQNITPRVVETSLQTPLSPLPQTTDSYTTLEQLGKMSAAFPTTNWANQNVNSVTQDIGVPISTNFTPGISGYVTHSELNAFGQQQQQNNFN